MILSAATDDLFQLVKIEVKMLDMTLILPLNAELSAAAAADLMTLGAADLMTLSEAADLMILSAAADLMMLSVVRGLGPDVAGRGLRSALQCPD